MPELLICDSKDKLQSNKNPIKKYQPPKIQFSNFWRNMYVYRVCKSYSRNPLITNIIQLTLINNNEKL